MQQQYLSQQQFNDWWIAISWKDFVSLLIAWKEIDKYYVFNDVVIDWLEAKKVVIKNAIFEDKFIIKDWTFNDSFIIEWGQELVFKKDFIIKWWTFNEAVVISWGIFKEMFVISWWEFNKWFYINGWKYDYFENPLNFNLLRITWWIYKDIVSVYWWIFNKLYVRWWRFESSLEFFGGVYNEISIWWERWVHFENITFKNNNANVVNIENLKIQSFSILNIWDVQKLKLLKIENFTNNWIFKLFNITPEIDSRIIIDKSDLWNTVFTKLNLKNSEVVIDSSSIVESSFNNVWLPNIINVFKENEKADEFSKLQESYRQLKAVFNNQWNRMQALNYGARELEMYYKVLNFTDNPVEKTMLFFSKYTNYFWLNWFLAIFWLFASWIVFFMFYEQETNLFESRLVYNFWANFWNYYLSFLSPLHKFSNTQPYLWETIFRFISLVLLYQAFVAFRKFSR